MSLTHAPTFGTGFAPFFLPLALFVGGIIIWMLMHPLQPRALSTRLSSLRVVLASYWPALWVVLAQVTVMFLVVRFAVGLHPAHSYGMFAFLVLIAAAYLENRSFSRVDARSAAQFTVLAHDLQVEQIDGYPGPVGKAARDAALAFATFGRVETVVTTKLLWAWTAPDRGGDA